MQNLPDTHNIIICGRKEKTERLIEAVSVLLSKKEILDIRSQPVSRQEFIIEAIVKRMERRFKILKFCNETIIIIASSALIAFRPSSMRDLSRLMADAKNAKIWIFILCGTMEDLPIRMRRLADAKINCGIKSIFIASPPEAPYKELKI